VAVTTGFVMSILNGKGNPDMESKEVKQERLILICNLCDCVTTAIEKYHSEPDTKELLAWIRWLEEECGVYLRT